jgi:hypothetical protein
LPHSWLRDFNPAFAAQGFRMPRLSVAPGLALALTLVPALAHAVEPPVPMERKQLVIISFDGAHDNKLWEKASTWPSAPARISPIFSPAPS